MVALVATGVAAQSLTGSITGTVKDEQGGVLPGATVTLTGKTGARTTVTDAEGGYRFSAVDPGTYAVTAELQGFTGPREQAVSVSVGNQLTIDLMLRIGGVSENVTVLGEAPVVDVKSSQTETSISQSLLAAAPITRTAVNVLNYAPGINSSSAYGGEASGANALLIDGVDTRDPEGGTAWTFYNYNLVQEVQFQGIGAPAEFGGFTGAVVNTITKSGGNRISGLFDLLGSSSSLGGNNITSAIATQNPSLASPAKTKKYIDITTQLGGPLKKDKLFYFVSAQRFQLDTDPAGPVTLRHEVSPRFNLKLTYQPTSNDNFSGHLQYDAYNIKGRVPTAYALVASDETTNRETAPEYVWLGQWRHIFGSNTFSEVKYTGWWGFFDLNPEVNKPGHYDENGNHYISQGWFNFNDRGRNQANASITHYADKFGKHELKFGAEFERSKVRNRYGYVGGLMYYDYGGQPYLAYNYGYDVSANNKRQSAFAQDSWRVNDRVTINPGVRFDAIQGNSPGLKNVYSVLNIAPRLGFAIDATGDNKTVFKGAYSQYYEAAEAQLFERGVPGISDYVTYDVSGRTKEEIDRVTTPVYQVDQDLKHPRVDEFYVGFERAIGGLLRFTASGIWRDSTNFVNSIIPSARWTAASVPNTLTGQPITGYRWANQAASQNDFLITNVAGFQYKDPAGNVIGTADPFRKYKSMMLVLNKRVSNRWQAQVSYVLAKATGTVNNTSGAQSSGRQFETPTLALVNVDGALTNDRTHEFKLLGGYQIPVVEVSVNAYFKALSGQNWTPFQRYSSGQLGSAPSSTWRQPLLAPRGSFRMPADRTFDLRLEKVFQIGGDRVGIYADMLNLANASVITGIQTRFPSVTVTGIPNPILGGAPGSVNAPRQINLGARWSF
jgi:hypothetical protein